MMFSDGGSSLLFFFLIIAEVEPFGFSLPRISCQYLIPMSLLIFLFLSLMLTSRSLLHIETLSPAG